MNTVKDLLKQYAKALPALTSPEVHELLKQDEFTDAQLQTLNDWLEKVIAKEESELSYEEDLKKTVSMQIQEEQGVLRTVASILLYLPKLLVQSVANISKGAGAKKDEADIEAIRKTLQ